ncbi:hypothetical protein GCM10009737_33220 [Nocardioides lentus]|uniref:Uncharacterized protein n=2 Tax=Nocardioides lentus TaxID=338077 RepID=A0ABP5B2U2_9ACTN
MTPLGTGVRTAMAFDDATPKQVVRALKEFDGLGAGAPWDLRIDREEDYFLAHEEVARFTAFPGSAQASSKPGFTVVRTMSRDVEDVRLEVAIEESVPGLTVPRAGP